jgi:4-carboxymuconolactone decarboxylase
MVELRSLGLTSPTTAGQHDRMQKKSRPPAAHQQFVRRFSRLGKAWDLVNEEGDSGPLDTKTQRLLKLAVGIGALREGAVHSGVRKARDAGASLAEMEQVVALAASTIGFPASVAAWNWVREEAGGSAPTRTPRPRNRA